MFNNFEKQVVKAISDLTPLVQELSKNHDIHKVSLAFTSSLFCFGKQPIISIQASEKQTDNYETHWDSLIFAIMGADAKADILDSVDIERITDNAMKYIKNMATDLYQQRLMAKSFQTASRDHYRKLVESEISDFFAGLYQPGTPDIQDGAKLQAELMKRVGLVFSTGGEI